MKRKLKILLEVAAVCMALILGMQWLSCLFDPSDVGNCMDYINTFQKLPENTAEVIIYGSSHAWRGCDNREMYRQNGIAAYNFGCNWQHLNTTALFLKESLKTQSPKVALIETFLTGELLKNVGMEGEVYYTRAFPFSLDKLKYLRHCFGNRLEPYFSYAFPLFAFHDNWDQLGKDSFQGWKNDPEKPLKRLGFMDILHTEPVELLDHTQFRQKKLPADVRRCLDDMVQMCREKGTEVVFFTTPYAKEYCYSQAMKEYAEENGCRYVDFFELTDTIGIDTQTDFADAGHLNTRGAVKVARYLGHYLKEHYDLTDYRNDPDSLWTKLLGAN